MADPRTATGAGIMHVVTFRWKPDSAVEQIDALTSGLHEATAGLPGLLRFHCGSDMGLRAGNVDFAIVAEFEDEAALHRYLTDPRHVAVVQQHAQAMVAEKQGVHLPAPVPAAVL